MMDNLRHLQLVILGIMKDIDELCVKYHIEYYLLGGSAIGAVRHKGFIPWDDDLDIMMDTKNYNRFIEVCRRHLDKEKYVVQVGLEDWPLNFTKVKLKGTEIREIENASGHDGSNGIFLDIFKLENSPSNRFWQLTQYICAKYYLCYQLSERGFSSAGFKKKIMMFLSLPLRNVLIRKCIKHYIEHFDESSEFYGSFYFRTRIKTAFTKKSIMGHPKRMQFEDIMLPVPEYVHEYLTQMFGDYMTPPPADKQVGLHMIDIDFGKY